MWTDDYYYDSGSFFGDGLAAATIIGIVIAVVLLWLFLAMIRWKIFTKAGERGWKSLIPIYCDYINFKICWEGKWFVFTLLAVIGIFLFFIPIVGPTICFGCALFLTVMHVVYNMQMARAFGQSTGFALGLMLFSFPFQLFLAFDADIRYHGSQPTPRIFGEIRAGMNKNSSADPEYDTNRQPHYGEQRRYDEQRRYGEHRSSEEQLCREQPRREKEPQSEHSGSEETPRREENSQGVRCPACGRISPPGSKFCLYCGSKLI